MTNRKDWNTKFDQLKCCVLIPTYNNDRTLTMIINGVLEYTDHVIIVNDGSTDQTNNLLKDYQHLDIISYPKNKGKGYALKEGFKKARELGYKFAITIDSDGQHFPNDLPNFILELEQNDHLLLIGARNMTQENVPGKSSFGNKFSNFWFYLFTGIKLDDTQSGYRLYPIKALKKVHFFTNRFEFEVEVIVKAAWRGIDIKNIPIQVHYQKPGERISHFRPLQDFSRISLLNTYFFILAFFFYIPFRYLKMINKRTIKNFIRDNFFSTTIPIHIKALSIGFGVFMGIFPVWGYQLIIGISLSHLFKLNKALFVAAAHISIPPMIPIIIYLSYKMGTYFVTDEIIYLSFNSKITLETIKDNFLQYFYGAMALALIGGIIATILAYSYLKIYQFIKRYKPYIK